MTPPVQPEREATSGPAPERTHSDDGMHDLTLIRWMLSMSPLERLETLQQNIRSLTELRNAYHRQPLDDFSDSGGP